MMSVDSSAHTARLRFPCLTFFPPPSPLLLLLSLPTHLHPIHGSHLSLPFPQHVSTWRFFILFQEVLDIVGIL